ncbi:DegV family protein, partial [Ruminococcaceae bacterium OttesenSCG-928-N02]|nr:DegV family protein [Ruminococcaceae bacterium OttesenSCG-928-N02]
LRGMKRALEALVAKVAEFTASEPKGSLPLAIAHGGNPQRAQLVKEMLQKQCPAIGEIMVVPTKGLSSVYANVGGIVLAY